MKKKLIGRGVIGFPVGIAIGYVIPVIISICIGDGFFHPVNPELVNKMGSELNAILIQTGLSGIMGTGFAMASVIWEIDSWSLAKQSGIYFAIACVIMFPISYFANWMPHSTGKAALVNRVLTINPSLKFDALAKLSVEELKDLAEAGAPAMPIGMDAARTAAEEYAGTTAVDSVTAEVDPELDESPAHYEVELQTALGEFEYLVDAYTGKVLSGQKDLLATAPVGDATAKPSAPSGGADIGYAKAKSIALNHAGVSENKAYDMEIELDDEDGTLVYEVEFKSGGMEYSYEINAASGAILKHETEIDD